MKFYVDENLPAHLSGAFDKLVGSGHRFRDHKSEHMQGTLDVELLDHLGTMGYHAIITKDAAQLENPDEREALRRNGLHWIGVRASGLQGRAELRGVTGTLLGGLSAVLSNWHSDPTAYVLDVHPNAWDLPATFRL